MQNTNLKEIYKVVIIGQGKTTITLERVGKTSIATKFVNGSFQDETQCTIDATCLQKCLQISSITNVKLSIWDTAGQQKYNAIVPVYYRDAVAAIVAYQITTQSSFDKVKKWIKQLKQYAPKNIVIYVAGNKTDLHWMREVPKEAVEKYCQTQNIKHWQVSAKKNININEMFAQLAKDIYDRHIMSTDSTNTQWRRGKLSLSIGQQDMKKESSKKGCCGKS